MPEASDPLVSLFLSPLDFGFPYVVLLGEGLCAAVLAASPTVTALEPCWWGGEGWGRWPSAISHISLTPSGARVSGL